MSYKEYYTQQLTAASIAHLEQIHTAVYGKKPPQGFFQAKYNTAYTGTQYIGFIAYTKDESQPIAYYGVIPCFVKHGSRLLLSAQSADTMTHPAYRFKGLFVELANQTYQLCRDVGIKLIFGFPNQNSAPGFLNKLNWQQTEALNRFVIPVEGLPLQKLAAKLPVLSKLYRVYTKQVLKKHLLQQNGIYGSVLTDGFSGVNRDGAYLNYKTYSATQVIKIGRSTIWLKIANGLSIGDMDVHEVDFDRTVTALKAIAKHLGLQQITFQSSPGTRLNGLFEQRYHAISSFPVIFLDLGSGIPLAKIKFTFADIDIF